MLENGLLLNKYICFCTVYSCITAVCSLTPNKLRFHDFYSAFFSNGLCDLCTQTLHDDVSSIKSIIYASIGGGKLFYTCVPALLTSLDFVLSSMHLGNR